LLCIIIEFSDTLRLITFDDALRYFRYGLIAYLMPCCAFIIFAIAVYAAVLPLPLPPR